MPNDADEEVPGGLRRLNARERLQAISAYHNLTHAAINSILALLRDLGIQGLPKDARTLMGTDQTPPDSAKFHYIKDALVKGINLQTSTGFNFPDNTVKLELSIDGIPVFKSPPTGFWPILCRVIGANDPYPFLCGAYCGGSKDSSKPKTVDEYLTPVIDDILRLQEEGIQINRQRYNVKLERVVCDVPARAFVKRTKGHTGK